MARATDSEINPYPGQINGEIFFQRDLLQRLMGGKCRNNEESPSPDKEYPGDLELNLGLSLGGCFADKEKKLVRSSSIADPATAWRLPQPVGLMRSCSVPAANLMPDSPEWSMDSGIPAAVVAGDRRRRRRELHALKRKRWVTDRAGCGRDAGRVGGSGECCEEDKREGVEEEEDEVEEETLTLALTGKKTGICPGSMGNAGAGLPPQPSIGNGLQLPYKAMPAGQDWGRNLNLNHPNGKTGGFPPVGSRAFTPSSQASLGSQGSSSSGVSEFESKLVQGFGISESNCNLDARSTASMQSLPEQSDQRATPVTAPLTTLGRSGKSIGEGVENPAKKSKINNGERNVMEEMPCVSTRGEGPNGKRIEGFLYKYKKGEEVRIVCVCHGSFLSPAEFVKHAGGGDVAHPLRHIVVNPSPSYFL